MLGRGMVANPGLALDIAASCYGADGVLPAVGWPQVQTMLVDFWKLVSEALLPDQHAGRLKQWLNLLQRHYPQAGTAFSEVRRLHKPAEVEQWMFQQGYGRFV